MDGHQFRGARIHRDMMLVSSVCRRALGCEWVGGKCGTVKMGFVEEKAARGSASRRMPANFHSFESPRRLKMQRNKAVPCVFSVCSSSSLLPPIRGSLPEVC